MVANFQNLSPEKKQELIKKLSELAVLKDGKSILLSKKIDEINKLVGDTGNEVKLAIQGLTGAIKGIPEPLEPIDYTAKLDELRDSLIEKIDEPIELMVDLQIK